MSVFADLIAGIVVGATATLVVLTTDERWNDRPRRRSQHGTWLRR